MENMDLAIVTDDREYGQALGLAILNVCRTIVINVFSKASFKEAGPEPARFDLVLWDGEQKEYAGKGVVFLVERPSMACRDGETGNDRIFKYSPARQMVADIFAIYSRVTGRQAVNVTPKGVHVYAFCGCAGGTGCSTVAMSVSQELTRFHRKQVLYLSLEELESTGSFIKGAASIRTMGYYLYQLFKDRNRKGMLVQEETKEYRPFMESFVLRDDFGVEAFRPTKGRNPLVDLTPEEMCIFVESLMDKGRYDAIIIDTGTGLSPAAVTCLEMAEKICLVTEEAVDLTREDHYLQYLITVAGEDVLRKMLKVENKTRHKIRNAFLDDAKGEHGSMIDTAMYIEHDHIYTEEGSIRKVLLEGNFGNDISVLTKKLIEPLA